MHDKLWLVIRDVPDNFHYRKYILQKGDILKLGRVKYRIRDYNMPSL